MLCYVMLKTELTDFPALAKVPLFSGASPYRPLQRYKTSPPPPYYPGAKSDWGPYWFTEFWFGQFLVLRTALYHRLVWFIMQLPRVKFVVQFIKMTEKQSAVGGPTKDSVIKAITVMNLLILINRSIRVITLPILIF